MENLLGIDVETTGLDEKKGKILEIGCVLYNVPTRAIIQQVSTLLYAEENPAEHINNITVDSLKVVKPELQETSISLIAALMQHCDVVVAHNARFDRAWIEVFPALAEISKQKPWLCTRMDVKWPGIGNLKLQSIASRMGVPYLDAHRSLPDVLIMLECLNKLPEFEEQLKRIVGWKFPDRQQSVLVG